MMDFSTGYTADYFEWGKDKQTDPQTDEVVYTGRGMIKIRHILTVRDGDPSPIGFMKRYYCLLTAHGYPAMPQQIEGEVNAMTLAQAMQWIEETYARYIFRSQDIEDLLKLPLRGHRG